MAKPTLTTDLTTISTCESTTNWSSNTQLGNAMFSAGSDVYKEGSNGIFVEAKSIAVQGIRFDAGTALGSNIDFTVTGRRLYMWIFVIAQTLVDTQANGGVRVYAEDSSGNYGFWYIGGSDTDWVGGGWKRVVIDLNQTPDANGGTDPTISDIKYVGAACKWVNQVGKAPSLVVDVMHYGTKLEVTGVSFTDATNGIDFNENGASADTIVRNDAGSWITDGFEVGDTIDVRNTTDNDGNYVIQSLSASTITLNIGDFTADNLADTDAVVEARITLQDIITEDDTTNDTQYGFVFKNRAGVYELCSKIIIGDEAGSNNMTLYTTNERIQWADNNLSSGDNILLVAQDTGETRVLFGKSDGTGDNKVGYAGSIMYAYNETYTTNYKIDFSTSITACLIYGSTFLNATDGILLSASATNNEWISNTVTNSGQVQTDNAIVRNCFFNSTTAGTADAAFLWMPNTDIKNSTFLVNSGTNISAIEHENNTGSPYTYDNLQFAGNTYDIYLSHATQSIVINATNGSNPSSKREGGSGTITINNTVTLSVKVIDENGNNIQNAQVAIYTDPGGVELMNEDTLVTGLAEEQYNYSTDQAIIVRVRKSSSGTTRYFPNLSSGTITSSGFTTTVTLIQDNIAEP